MGRGGREEEQIKLHMAVPTRRNAELERSINYAKKNYVQFLTESLSKSACKLCVCMCRCI